MIGINHHQTLNTDQAQEETQSTVNPTGAHSHNLQADTTLVNKRRSTISQLIINKEAEHRQENDPLTSEHTRMTNRHTNKAEPRLATHDVMTTNSDDATNGDAKKKSKELTNYMKKKAAEEQSIRKKKRRENATKNDDAKCNDELTVLNADNGQKLTGDHQSQKCRKTYRLKFQNKI